jgi:hypothetical protein
MMRQSLAGWSVVGLMLMTTSLVAQQPAYQSKPETVTATIEAIDKANRVVTLKGPEGNSFDVKAPDQMEGFNSLKVGDEVTANYFAAVMIRARKPGDPASTGEPATTVRRTDRTPGSETRQERTFTVTVEAVDLKAPSLRVKGPQGRVVTMAVTDPKQLQNLKVGDTVDLTYYESLLVKVGRPAKKPGQEELTAGIAAIEMVERSTE